jgi:hypothetical protein
MGSDPYSPSVHEDKSRSLGLTPLLYVFFGFCFVGFSFASGSAASGST